MSFENVGVLKLRLLGEDKKFVAFSDHFLSIYCLSFICKFKEPDCECQSENNHSLWIIVLGFVVW